MSKLTVGTQLGTVVAGEHFIYAGLEFIALEHTACGTVAITADCIHHERFDNWNSGNEAQDNWKTSTLKQWLNGEFVEQLLQSGAAEADFVSMILDLTADDGLDDYGTDESKVGLLGVENYRKYCKLLPPINDYWWLITPGSTKANEYSYSSCSIVVCSDGTLVTVSPCETPGGVRPICALHTSTLVYVVDGVEWISKDDAPYKCIELSEQQH